MDLRSFEWVDLSYTYDQDTLYWPTATKRFDLEELSYGVSEGGYFYSAYALSTPEHGGTHLDAPIHFAESGWRSDEVPIERLIAPAVVVDVSQQATANRDYRLAREDLMSWEAEHGEIPHDSALLLKTGWGRYWPDAAGYLGDDTPGDASNLHFPGYGAEAVRFLVEQRSVAILGIDTASLDHGPSSDFVVHQIAGAANVLGLENVAHIDRLPATGAWIIALPIKTRGSGGPVRIVAMLPRSFALSGR